MNIKKNENNIALQLNQNEALVLFDWLYRFNSAENKNHLKIDSSEEQLLFNIEACLESILTTPFKPNYDKLLEEARQNVCNNT